VEAHITSDIGGVVTISPDARLPPLPWGFALSSQI